MSNMQTRLRNECDTTYKCFNDYDLKDCFNDNICHYGLLEDLTYNNCYGIEQVFEEMECE